MRCRDIVRLGRCLAHTARRTRAEAGRLHNVHIDWPAIVSLSVEIVINGKKQYQYKRCIVESIPGIYVNSRSNGFMATFQISNSTSMAELVELRTFVEWAFFLQDSISNKLMLVLQLDFKLTFTHNHASIVGGLSKTFRVEVQLKTVAKRKENTREAEKLTNKCIKMTINAKDL